MIREALASTPPLVLGCIGSMLVGGVLFVLTVETERVWLPRAGLGLFWVGAFVLLGAAAVMLW